MADLSITASNVLAGTGAVVRHYIAGEAIAAGEVFRVLSSDGKAYLADTTSATEAAASGIAVSSAAAGQYVAGVTSGPVTLGAVLTVGTIYGVSDNAGKLRPIADNGSGDFVTVIGGATTTSSLQVKPNALGVAVPA